MTSELLMHEKVLFETRTGIYNNESAYANLVRNVETILMKTNESWEKMLEDIAQKTGKDKLES